MERILYHGSEKIIQKPQYGKGKPYNDYGKGFYCTENQNMAKEWAAGFERDGFANRYIIDENGLSILNLQDPSYTILTWLTILLENRIFDTLSPLAAEGKRYLLKTFSIPYRSYDIIIGYRADDSYFSFAQDFLNGTISIRQLNHALHLGKLGEQYVLCSKSAFRKIRFLDYEIAGHDEWFLKRQARDRLARKDYFHSKSQRYKKGDLYITHIIDERITPDDVRLRTHLS